MDFNNDYLNGVLERKELNLFYLSMWIKQFGNSLINIFVPIYLLTIGYSIVQILFYYFLIALGFILFSYFGVKIVSKIGLNHSILVSTIPFILYLLGLRILPDYPLLFYLLPFVLNIRRVLYNYSYHFYFIKYSSKKHRGKQLSFKSIINKVINVIAPATGGLIAGIYGFNTLLLIGSIILLISALPLFWNKELKIKPSFNFKGLIRDVFREKGELISFSSYGVDFEIGRVIWPIFVFLVVANVADYGILASLTTLISLIVFYFVGVLTDKYDVKKMLIVGSVLRSISWVLRIFADTYNKILLVGSYKELTAQVLHIPWDVYSYALAQKKNKYKFIVAREFTFNLARVIILPVLILVFLVNFHPFLISFLIGGISSLGYYSLISEKI